MYLYHEQGNLSLKQKKLLNKDSLPAPPYNPDNFKTIFLTRLSSLQEISSLK